MPCHTLLDKTYNLVAQNFFSGAETRCSEPGFCFLFVGTSSKKERATKLSLLVIHIFSSKTDFSISRTESVNSPMMGDFLSITSHLTVSIFHARLVLEVGINVC